MESIKCGKASLDYESERDGVASKWMPSSYDDVIDSITRRVRATNPELFADFDALKEKSSAPSKNRERIHNRVLVGMVADALVPLLGDRTWEIPYRLVANYLVADRMFKFSKAEVVGELRQDNVEFLKTQLGLLVDKKSNTASFLNALRAHFDEVDQAASDAANANLTPDERKLRADGREGRQEGCEERADCRRDSARSSRSTWARALSGTVSPDEVAKIIKTAAKDRQGHAAARQDESRDDHSGRVEQFPSASHHEGRPQHRRAQEATHDDHSARLGTGRAGSEQSEARRLAFNGKPALAAAI